MWNKVEINCDKSMYRSKLAPDQMVKIPNLEQYVGIVPKETGTRPIPKRVRKIPVWFHDPVIFLHILKSALWTNEWNVIMSQCDAVIDLTINETAVTYILGLIFANILKSGNQAPSWKGLVMHHNFLTNRCKVVMPLCLFPIIN